MMPEAMHKAIPAEGSIPAARYCRATSVQVEPTGSLIKRIGWVDLSEPPMRWWSRTSRMSASSAPLTAWLNSLWSTRISLGLVGLTRSDLLTAPTNWPKSLTTGKIA